MQIYFDNSATTKVDQRVLESMQLFFSEEFGNPHSAHSFGQKAQSVIDDARDSVANYLNCEAKQILFTAGATESNNLAIWGTVRRFLKEKKKIHIITTKIEHPSVLEIFQQIEKDLPEVEVDYLGVDKNGVIKLDKLKTMIKPHTVLVSIMYANNEVGSIQPIKEAGALIRAEREGRENSLPIYLHTDAVQAFNYLNCDVEELGVDFLSFSGHKIYGPKGTGALYFRNGIKLVPLVFGGHQERGLRSGTLNVPGIVGLAKAVELVELEKEKNLTELKRIKENLIRELKQIDDVRFNGAGENQLPNIVNVSFKSAEGESILMMLDMEGIAVSTGSACSSGSLEPSHVLTAMNVPPEWTHGSLRISLGKFNTEEEADVFIQKLKLIIEKLRKMAP